MASVSWISSPRPGFVRADRAEDLGREHVAADRREVGRRILRAWASRRPRRRARGSPRRPPGVMQPYHEISSRETSCAPSTLRPYFSWTRSISGRSGIGRVDQVVAQEHRERLPAHVRLGDAHRMSQAQRLALADEVDVRHLRQRPHLLQLVELPLLLEELLELDVAVEVVLDGALVAPRDDEDVGESRAHGLLDHQLDRRRVDDREHLLGLRLGGRQEPRAESGGGDHRFVDLHASCPPARDGESTRRASAPGQPGVRARRLHSCGDAHVRVHLQELRAPVRDRPVHARRHLDRMSRVRRRAAQGVRAAGDLLQGVGLLRHRPSQEGVGPPPTEKKDDKEGSDANAGDTKIRPKCRDDQEARHEAGGHGVGEAARRSTRLEDEGLRDGPTAPRSACSEAPASTRSWSRPRRCDIDTPYGAPSAPPVIGEVGGRRVAFIPRHGAAPRVPAAPGPVSRQRVGDEGAGRPAGPRAERLRVAAAEREARRLRDLRPARRPHARPRQHVLRRAGHDPHLVRRPLLRRDARRSPSRRVASWASRCTTGARSS